MSKPIFTHDCGQCRFLGHYFGHDVYHCRGNSSDNMDGRGTVLARHSDEPSEYSSHPLSLLQSAISNPDYNIGGYEEDDSGKRWAMPYRDFIFSDRSKYATVRAMVCGLVAHCHELFKGG